MKAWIYWDLVLSSAWGLLAPVFAIFLLEKIALGNVAEAAKIVGFATLFYWVTKALLQIPIGIYLDTHKGEMDDFWFFAIGTIITGLIPLGFLFSSLPWHIYVLQMGHAAGMAMIVPSAYAIFIRHTDKGKEAYESSLDSTFMGLGAGIAGALGGMMAAYVGFNLIFILTSIFTFISVFFIFTIRKDMSLKVSRYTSTLRVGKEKVI